MEIPILVAIISVVGSLLGTIVGGSIVTGGNYFLARRRERTEFRTACRLIESELLYARVILNHAVEEKSWWTRDLGPKTEAWEQYKHVLAQYLSFDAWDAVRLAVNGVSGANVVASTPHAHPTEITLDATTEALTIFLKHIEVGRASLLRHLV